MNHQEFNNYLTLLCAMLKCDKSHREAIADELRDHLELRCDEWVDQGKSQEEAVRLALEEFGDAAGIAAEFTTVFWNRKRRVIMRQSLQTVAAVAVMLTLAMFFWPNSAERPIVPLAHADARDPAAMPDLGIFDAQVANDEVRRKLEQPIHAEFVETPLSDALDYLARLKGLQFHLHATALANSGVGRDAPVDLNLKGVPVRLVLDLIFKELDLVYVVRDGVVVVTTQEYAEATETRAYRVSDLVGEHGEDTVMYTLDALMHTITKHADPESWAEVGGPATISAYRGVLVVSQTDGAHYKIRKLLGELRASLTESAPGKRG